MFSIQHKYTSSVERHMLAYLKVRGSILGQGEPSFCCDVRIYTSLYTENTGGNTSSKHERYTRNGANRISEFNTSLIHVF